MKKLFSLCLVFFGVLGMIKAVPAPNVPVKIKQADGTTITVYIRGDEGTKWLESTDGYSLLQKDRQCYYTVLDAEGRMVISDVKAHDKADRTRQEKKFLRTVPKNLRYSTSQVKEMRSRGPVASVAENVGKDSFGLARAFSQRKSAQDTVVRRVPVILVNFADLEMTTPKESYDSLIGLENYTAHGCPGSFRDYFLDNSRGLFQFQADVIGPVTLSRNMAYYGRNNFYGQDSYPDQMAAEACQLAAEMGVDFSQYDFDNDGIVDGFHVIYPGQGEEVTGNGDAVWAHKWIVRDEVSLNGKKLNVYSCSGEFSLNNDWAFIGTLAHELSHVFGLPDLYDTDYTTNGSAVTPGDFDVMAQGSYNNGGKTPPLHNAWCRVQMGFLEERELTDTCTVELRDAEKASLAFIYKTPTYKEYFVLDYRGEESKWDSEIPGHGMLIYAVNENVPGWGDQNCINCQSNNRGFYIKQADGGSRSMAPMGPGTPFPGVKDTLDFTDETAPSAKTVTGRPTKKPLYRIHEMEEGGVTFLFMGEGAIVYDNAGGSRLLGDTVGGQPGDTLAIAGREAVAMRLYPNPASDYITLQSASEISCVKIYNTSGAEVSYTAVADKKEIVIDIAGLQSGMYIVEIATARGIARTKLLKTL